MPWQVTGIGAETGAEYVYTVDAPPDAPEMRVLISAGRMHGASVREALDAGEQAEYLRPGMTAEYRE